MVMVWEYFEFIILFGQYCSVSDMGNWVYLDGIIFYLYIGKIYVKDKMVIEVRELIIEYLVKYIEFLQVDVGIVVFCFQKVYVFGEVNQFGQQFIINVLLIIIDVVNLVGGLIENVDWGNVVLIQGGKKLIILL